MSGWAPGCMTVPLRIGLELVSLAAYGGLVFKPSRHPGYRGAVHVPASLRVGAAMAAGLLIAASTPVAPPSTAAPANIAGMIVFLDPGHNGANDASISRQVPTGRGGTKDCQAGGSATNDGYPEHTFAWDTTLRIRAALTHWGCGRRCHAATTPGWDPASTSAPRWPIRSGPTRS